VKGYKVQYIGQIFQKDHARNYEEAWRTIPQEHWVHNFINTLDTTPINWYLQAELHLITVDWEGMTRNFVTTFLFESQYPSVDQELYIIRHKIFEEASSAPLEQEEDEWCNEPHYQTIFLFYFVFYFPFTNRRCKLIIGLVQFLFVKKVLKKTIS